MEINYKAFSKVLKYGETTEDDFHKLLDENPNDHHTRLVFADWLQDRDDPRAEGYRMLGTLKIRPHLSNRADYPVEWTHTGNDHEQVVAYRLPNDVWHNLPTDISHHQPYENIWWKAFWGNRRQAEDAAAHAFAQLPAKRKQEIMNGH